MTTTKRRWRLASATVVATLSCAVPLCAAPTALAQATTAPSPTKAGADLSLTADVTIQRPHQSAATRGMAPVPPGGIVTYTLTAKNSGPSVAKNAKVTDTLPAGLTFVSSTDDCTAAGQKVTCGPVDVLAVGASKTWTFQTRVDSGYTGDGTDLKNNAVISSDTKDPQGANNSASAELPGGGGIGTPSADLSTEKTAVGTEKVSPGQEYEYTITTKNAGPSDATKVVATDNLPAPISFVSSSDGCTAEGQTVTCTADVVKNGAAKSWTFKVKLDSAYKGDGTDLKNTASSSSEVEDPNSENGESTPVDPPGAEEGEGGIIGKPSADLSTEKTAVGTEKVSPGQEYEYTITTKNAGPSDATKVVATDELPKPLTFVSSSDGCTATGQTVTCTADVVKNGAAKSWTFKVKLDPAYTGTGSDIKNTASSSSEVDDPNSGNGESTPVDPPGGTVAEPLADLEVTKTSS
ncbi:DUF11 domain-containing protein [Streptomyces sp. TRM66268-LWL]|uniref:DUF11 domain-containing protein n=1 Tax=Streptomyces polyasparticus TaxID=2767826 RepID=A0ABR7SB90_9ACTN|nr:DUF11 domain-containing protein [Streptomyces polyasparticus]MBC9712741.1 DUF11 domain-containing protein [Streptomyces polyasparticus]